MRDVTAMLAAVTGGVASGYREWSERLFGKPAPIGPGPSFQTPLFRKTWENYLSSRSRTTSR